MLIFTCAMCYIKQNDRYNTHCDQGIRPQVVSFWYFKFFTNRHQFTFYYSSKIVLLFYCPRTVSSSWFCVCYTLFFFYIMNDHPTLLSAQLRSIASHCILSVSNGIEHLPIRHF